jgi:aminoglycoside/choline kinase family phosphotransferase
MVKDGKPRLIDFQGARFGPIQYDLASLLIDPYVQLPDPVQERLLKYCIDNLSARAVLDRHGFIAGYRHAALARNLQILGAFGFLTRIKGKPAFTRYIRPALDILIRNLSRSETDEFPALHFTAHTARKLL